MATLNSLQIYKASAGSGKTYRLTFEYIKLLFQDFKNYRKTLAMTFTNNACGEMKHRFLSALYKLSFEERNAANDKPDYMSQLMAMGFSEKEVREKAFALCKEILHNYSFFYIETIDSFTQNVIRNFAKDLGLPPKFNLVLDNENVLETVTHDLLVNSLQNEELQKALVTFALSDLEENQNTDIKKAIKNESKNFFNESYQDAYANTPIDTEKLQKLFALFKDENKAFAKNYEAALVQKATEALRLIQEAGLDVSTDFKQKSKSKLTTLLKLQNKDLSKPLSEEVCELDNVKPSKGKTAEIEMLYNSTFPDILRKIVQEMNPDTSAELRAFNTKQQIIKNEQGIILSQYIKEGLNAYCREENSFLIGYANKFLQTIIDNSDTPFIYEKIGQYIEHIMIDEFQDTSKMQWKNFSPIVQNLPGGENHALIIGDVKQSIYRFRNGDWRLMHNLSKHNKQTANEVKNCNYRSFQNIVDFNNAFFTHYSKFVDGKFNDSYAPAETADAQDSIFGAITDIYADCIQDIPEKTKQSAKKGCVEIKLIDLKEAKENEEEDPILEEIFQKVISLFDMGRKPEDIAFLCYRNSDICDLVTFFNEKKTEFPEYADKLSIMSKEALLLSNSPAVQFITTYLQWLMVANKENKDAQFFESFLKFTFNGIHPGEELPQPTISRNRSLFETCEEIIRTFRLNESETDAAFITDFQNLIYRYSQNNNTSILHFLEHWDEIKSKTYLQQNDTPGFMNALTIHKSKGLEYPVVIMPQFIKARPKQVRSLYKTEYTELPMVKLTGDMTDTNFKDEYVEELYNLEIDNINALYVACTRPREELYIYEGYKTSDKNPSVTVTVFNEIIQQLGFGESDDSTFRFGKPMPSEVHAKKSDITFVPLSSYTIEMADNAKLLPVSGYDTFPELVTQKQTSTEKGNLLHTIMEHVTTSKDIARAINQTCPPELYTIEDKAELQHTIQTLISNPQVAPWFDDTLWDTISTEQAILLTNEYKGRYQELASDETNGKKRKTDPDTRRPDRIMVKGKQVVIIDYKTGTGKYASYKKQMREYLDILSLMGYNPCGYIWYVDQNSIEEVA